MCPHTATCVLTRLHVSSYYYICLLIPLHMGAHTIVYICVFSNPLQTGRSASGFARRRSSRKRSFAKMSSLSRDPRERWPRAGNSRRARKRKVQGGQTKGTDILLTTFSRGSSVCVCVGVSVCVSVSACKCPPAHQHVSFWSAS